MPVFEYRCNDCTSQYEILHKSAEQADIIECPACHSKSYTKKFSTFAASVGAGSSSYAESPCASGACNVPSYSPCASGMCGLG